MEAGFSAYALKYLTLKNVTQYRSDFDQKSEISERKGHSLALLLHRS